MPFHDGERGMTQGPDLAGREPDLPQVLVRRRQDGLRAHIVPLRAQAAPDRGGARRGQLLSDHDPREALESGGASTQGRNHAARDQPRHDGIGLRQGIEAPADRVAGSEQGGALMAAAAHSARRPAGRRPVTRPVFRFAPSPNGRLHLGHAYSALLNERLAAACDGRLLLRIEDIDPARCRPAYEAAIYDDLAWLGLAWETPVRRQSEHLGRLSPGAAATLRRAGLLYPCFCSRRAIVRRWRGERPGRASPGLGTPMALRSTPERAGTGRFPMSRAASPRARLMPGASTWKRP